LKLAAMQSQPETHKIVPDAPKIAAVGKQRARGEPIGHEEKTRLMLLKVAASPLIHACLNGLVIRRVIPRHPAKAGAAVEKIKPGRQSLSGFHGPTPSGTGASSGALIFWFRTDEHARP